MLETSVYCQKSALELLHFVHIPDIASVHITAKPVSKNFT